MRRRWPIRALMLCLVPLLTAVPVTRCFAIEVGDQIGPYSVTRILPEPPGGAGDVECSSGQLFSLENYMGIIHEIDPVTGAILADFWIPGDFLHDDAPWEAPRGLAWDGSNFFIATASAHYLMKLTLGEPPAVIVDWTVTLPSWPFDLAYAEGYLYYPEYTGPIQKVDPSTGAVVGSLPSPYPWIYGLTYDGDNLLALCGPCNDLTIWVISIEDGSILDTWVVPDWNYLMGGLAFDLDTETLYIATHAAEIIVAQKTPSPVSSSSWTRLKRQFR